MQLNSPALLKQFHNLLQGELFPVIESVVGPLNKYSQLLVGALSLVPMAGFAQGGAATGRPRRDRQALATAFLAKAVYNLTTTRQLLDRLHCDPQLRRLCGWESRAAIPAESTFSRAFSEFAAAGLPAEIHAALVRKTQQSRTVAYIARDSTAIEAREHLPEDNGAPNNGKAQSGRAKPAQATRKAAKGKPKHGRRRRGGAHPRAKLADRGSRIQRQHHMTLSEMLAELSTECSLGVKTSSKGHQQYWRGYKLHWDIASDGRIPVSCVLTGAGVHDSQVAIPLMEMSKDRIGWKCDVMDSAYDARAIRKKASDLKHEVLIKPVTRHNAKTPPSWTEEQKERFKIRTIVEQLNGRLKDEFGGRVIYVRGAAKVLAHLMFGVLALTVDQILRTVS